MDFEKLVKEQLAGSVIRSDSGVKLYTPDGRANYAALWTRDFYYMIDDAGEHIAPEEIRQCLEYTYSHARASDGWMPDRVDARGDTRYTAGNFDITGIALPNLDDNAFAVLSAEIYRRYVSEDEWQAFIGKWRETLLRGLRATPVGENGLIWNDPEKPHSPYGFTDCICKTGYLCYESLIQWQACRVAAAWGDAYFAECAKKTEASLEAMFFEGGRALPLAATVDCRQTDVWAACYALAIGFPLSEACAEGIRKALVDNYEGIVQKGQLRHMLPGEFWDKHIERVPDGTYQNGAFWATPVKWLVAALLPYDRALAVKTMDDLKRDFEEGGCCECINGAYRKLPDYVASATAAYGAEKLIKG